MARRGRDNKADDKETDAEEAAKEEISDVEDPAFRPSPPDASGAVPLPPIPAAGKPSLEPAVYDPICQEQKRHRANCDCKGAARGPIAS